MYKRIIILLILFVAFLGCEGEGLNIKIKYDRTQGLKTGDRVVFEDNNIGQVKSVTFARSGYYVVDVWIKKEFRNAVTEHSRFYIITDLDNKDRKAIEMTLVRKGGIVLKDGAMVDGSTRPSVLIDKMVGDFEKGLEGLKKKFEEFSEGLTRIPQSEEFKRLEEKLKGLTEEIERSGKAAGDKIQKEVLPFLEKELEKLRERLKKIRKKEEEKPVKI